MEIGFGRNAPQPCAYHAAVLAPELDALTIRRFRKVLVYDTPLTLGMLDAISALAPDAQLAVGKPVAGDAAELLSALQLERAAFIPFYQALRRAQTGFYNREALLDYFTRERAHRAIHARLRLILRWNLAFCLGERVRRCGLFRRRGGRSFPKAQRLQSLHLLHRCMNMQSKNALQRSGRATHQHHHEEEQP